MSDINRRAVLVAGASAAVAGGLPAVGAPPLATERASPIQVLWQAYLACCGDCERLSDEADAASDRFNALVPAVPDELAMSDIGAHYYGLSDYLRYYRRVNEGIDPDGFSWVCADGWRHGLCRPPAPSESCPHHLMAGFRPMARQMLQVAERYEAAVNDLAVSTGYDAAHAAWDVALDRKNEIEQQILAEPAKSLADLVSQREIVVARGHDEDDFEKLTNSIFALTISAGGANG
jgi:hypothetical protein